MTKINRLNSIQLFVLKKRMEIDGQTNSRRYAHVINRMACLGLVEKKTKLTKQEKIDKAKRQKIFEENKRKISAMIMQSLRKTAAKVLGKPNSPHITFHTDSYDSYEYPESEPKNVKYGRKKVFVKSSKLVKIKRSRNKNRME